MTSPVDGLVVALDGAGAGSGGIDLVKAAVRSARRLAHSATVALDHRLGSPIQRLVLSIGRWLERDRELRQLQSLGDHMLKDMGVSRCDIEREIRAGRLGK